MSDHQQVIIDRTGLTLDPLVVATNGWPFQLEDLQHPEIRFERTRPTHPDVDGGPLTAFRKEIAAVSFRARLWGTDIDDAQSTFAVLEAAVDQFTFDVSVVVGGTGWTYKGEIADRAPAFEDGQVQIGTMLVQVTIPVQPNPVPWVAP